MDIKSTRKWYVIFQGACSEPTFLISAFSTKDVCGWLKFLHDSYRIMPANTQHLIDVMSGKPDTMIYPLTPAPDSWYMKLNNQLCRVVILD